MQVAAPEADIPGPSTSSATSHLTQKSEDSSDREGLEISTGVDFALKDPFTKSVKEATGWEESKKAPRKIRK